MRDFIKKMILVAAVVVLVGIAVPGFSVKSEAADGGAGNTGVMAQIVVPEEEVFAAVTYSASSGIVIGSGVRLRKQPSTTATILELMDVGEYVNISYGKSTTNWYYLKRLKTGTYGYASKTYIAIS